MAIGAILAVSLSAAVVHSGTSTSVRSAHYTPRSSIASQQGSSVDFVPLAPATGEGVPPTGNLGIDALLLVAWFVGSAGCLAILIGSAWRVARMKRGWREEHIAGVPVLVSHDVGPAVIGLVHHGIVVPRWIETLDPASQDMVMAHEREHLRAGDPLLLWSASLLVALMPWNVGLWFALRRLRHAIEMDCDARVLHSRPDARAYCTLLLNVGERTLAGVAPIAALAEPATLLQRRIDGMTTRGTSRWRATMAGMAAAALVLIACYAPRPEVAPSVRVAAMVDELSGLLRHDAAHAAVSESQRSQLVDALNPGSGDSGALRFGSLARRDSLMSPAFAPHIDAQVRARIDSVILTSYPGLTTRTDETPALVGVIFDKDNNVTRQASRIGNVTGDAGVLLMSLGIDTLSARTTSLGLFSVKQWHTHVIFAAEDTGPPIGPPRFRGGIGSGDSLTTVPPLRDRSREYGRRTDSLARAAYPESHQPRSDAIVVVAIFAQDGKLLTHSSRQLPLTDVFDTTVVGSNDRISSRGAKYLLGLVMPAELGHDDLIGSTVMRDAPHLVLVSAVRRKE